MKKKLSTLMLVIVTIQASENIQKSHLPSDKAAIIIAQQKLLLELGKTFEEKDPDSKIDALVWDTLTEKYDALNKEHATLTAQIAVQKTPLPSPQRQPSYFEQILKDTLDSLNRLSLRLVPLPSTEQIRAHYNDTREYYHIPIATTEINTDTKRSTANSSTLSPKQLHILCFSLLACISLRYFTS